MIVLKNKQPSLKTNLLWCLLFLGTTLSIINIHQASAVIVNGVDDSVWNNVNSIITTSGNAGAPASSYYPTGYYPSVGAGGMQSINGNLVMPSGATNIPITNGLQDWSVYGQGGTINPTAPSPVITPPVVQAQAMGAQDGYVGSAECGISVSKGTWKYCMLTPVNGLLGDKKGSGKDATEIVDVSGGIQPFFAKVYKLGITIAIALAIVMISFGGIRLATTDSIGGTEEGRKMINAALAGLFLALFSYVLLNTINPALTDNGASDLFGQSSASK